MINIDTYEIFVLLIVGERSQGSQGQVPLTHMPDTAVLRTVRRAL